MDQKNQNRNDRKKQNRQGVLSLLAWALALTIGFNYLLSTPENAIIINPIV